ncbi:MAG: arsenate reductase ArsC [Acidobacteriota bacterium]
MTEGAGILVLCTGNSCRSQMAEALFRRELDGRLPVYSAGTEPTAEIHPVARQVMEEEGLDLAGQRPKHLTEYLGRVPIHTIVIVCDGAAKSCPTVWPGAYERLMWPVEDPAAFEGDAHATLAKFRQVRNELAGKIGEWNRTAAPAGT